MNLHKYWAASQSLRNCCAWRIWEEQWWRRHVGPTLQSSAHLCPMKQSHQYSNHPPSRKSWSGMAEAPSHEALPSPSAAPPPPDRWTPAIKSKTKSHLDTLPWPETLAPSAPKLLKKNTFFSRKSGIVAGCMNFSTWKRRFSWNWGKGIGGKTKGYFNFKKGSSLICFGKVSSLGK